MPNEHLGVYLFVRRAHFLKMRRTRNERVYTTTMVKRPRVKPQTNHQEHLLSEKEWIEHMIEVRGSQPKVSADKILRKYGYPVDNPPRKGR